MSAVTMEYMAKAIMKMIGVKPEDLNPSVLIPQLLSSQGIAPEDAQRIVANAHRILLDYERNQALQNMRMLAIINHLGIDDPAIVKVETLEGNENG